MKNQPNKIWIINRSKEKDFEDLRHGASWTDKFPDDDLCYISVSSVLARIKELEAEIDNDESEYSITSLRMMIKELKNLIK